METTTQVQNRERKDFSTIRTSLAIPNLIDVQRRSYERFLQMNLLPDEREGRGLQSVFTSIFPFSDFRETCSLDFVKYTIGDWQCKCGELSGLEYLRMTCSNCSAKIMTEHPHEETVTCPDCGVVNQNRVTRCDTCGNPVDLQLTYSISECQERGVTHAVPLRVTFRLFVFDKDPETGMMISVIQNDQSGIVFEETNGRDYQRLLTYDKATGKLIESHEEQLTEAMTGTVQKTSLQLTI